MNDYEVEKWCFDNEKVLLDRQKIEGEIISVSRHNDKFMIIALVDGMTVMYREKADWLIKETGK